MAGYNHLKNQGPTEQAAGIQVRQGSRLSIKVLGYFLSRSPPHLPCGYSHGNPRTCAGRTPGTAPPPSKRHHPARYGRPQVRSFFRLWRMEQGASHSPVACIPLGPPSLPSHHHRQSPRYLGAAPPTSQSRGCLLLPASAQRDLRIPPMRPHHGYNFSPKT